MDSSDRKMHWQQTYSGKSPRSVSWYQPASTASLQLISDTGIAKNAPIIDVGGGASVLVDQLIARGYARISVLDISEQALQHARARLAQNAAQVNWIVEDVLNFTAAHPFELWHDRALFHFFTDPEEQDRYVEILNKSLSPGAHVLIATFAIDGPLKCSGLDTMRYDAPSLGTRLGGRFEHQCSMNEMHITPWGGAQAFTYFWFTFTG